MNRFRLRFKLAKGITPDEAVDTCHECFASLDTHADVFYATLKEDTSKYAEQFPLCEECLISHSDIYNQSG